MVAKDELEGGVRAHLNLGYNIERLQGYREWHHGEAVGAGMALACQISVGSGRLDEAVLQKLLLLHEVCGLPTRLPSNLPAAVLLAAMSNDKKVTAGKIHYILLSKLGEALITDCVTEQEIVDVVSACYIFHSLN